MGTQATFLGAARNVTGSCTLIEHEGTRLLVDCGLFQEREYQSRNWAPFRVPAPSIHAVVLTHAHLDHCGLLPRLVRQGFRGKIVCTPATRDIAEVVLRDAAHIQEEDARFKAKRHARENRSGPHGDPQPLYTEEDVARVVPALSATEYETPTVIAPGATASFSNAGHILGSAAVLLTLGSGPQALRLLFSGDVGRWNRPILCDPATPPAADILFVESTYGDRLHETDTEPSERLAAVIQETVARGGNIVIPTFAIERAQEILYHLSLLRRARRIPPLLVFLDSPMAVRVTEIFRAHPERFDPEMRELVLEGHSPFSFQGLRFIRTREESKSINHVRGSAIILAGSGMCTGGRIKHHLAHNIGRPECTILFVGYQANGTLGRLLVDGAEEVRILGREQRVRARVEQIRGFSGHADRDELCRWLRELPAPPQRVFVIHGGANVSQGFAEFLTRQTGWPAHAPTYGESISLA